MCVEHDSISTGAAAWNLGGASLWLCALGVPPAAVILGLATRLPWAKRTLVNVKQAETGQALPQLGLAARNPQTQAAAAWTSLQAGSGRSDRCYAARDNWYILLILPWGDPSSKFTPTSWVGTFTPFVFPISCPLTTHETLFSMPWNIASKTPDFFTFTFLCKPGPSWKTVQLLGEAWLSSHSRSGPDPGRDGGGSCVLPAHLCQF